MTQDNPMTAEPVAVSDLEKLKHDAGIPHLPTQDTYWFRKAMSGAGPRAFDWSDKPHRLVFDLCRIIEAQAAAPPKGEPRVDDLTRPIIGIENRTAQEVFDIMSDRITRTLEPKDTHHE